MNLRDARKCLMASVLAGNAVLMTSGSGIGKSQLQLSVFNEIKARDAAQGIRWGLGVVFAATQTPPDLIGYQFKGEREFQLQNAAGEAMSRKITVTDPSVPLWMISVPNGDDPGGMPAFMYDRFYLIIEEYGQGEADTKRALAEVFLNGGTAPWYLPPGSIRVASSNAGSRYGVTKDFDFCIARRTEFHIQGDVEIWLADFADKPYVYQGRQWQVMPVSKAWAKRHPEVLFEAEPKDQGPWCNPRTFCAADRYMQVAAEQNGGVIPHDQSSFIEVMAGTIGMAATTSVIGDLQFIMSLPQYEDVVKDPMNTPVPNKADLLMLMAYTLAGRVQVADLAPVIQYVKRLPKDMAVTFVSSLLRRDYKSYITTAPMQAWISQNATLVSLIASLSQA